MKGKKQLTPKQEIKQLRKRIEELKDAHKTLLRKDVKPLMKKLAVLELAQRLQRAQRALVKTVEEDKGNPQLELLSMAENAPAPTVILGSSHTTGLAPALSLLAEAEKSDQ
jgi:nucleotide-binding universal stress UspA family protein